MYHPYEAWIIINWFKRRYYKSKSHNALLGIYSISEALEEINWNNFDASCYLNLPHIFSSSCFASWEGLNSTHLIALMGFRFMVESGRRLVENYLSFFFFFMPLDKPVHNFRSTLYIMRYKHLCWQKQMLLWQ